MDNYHKFTDATHDFYELLSVSPDATSSALKSGYRKAALRYHPDKSSDPSAVEKFQLVQIADALFSDPAAKAVYDNARAARLLRQKQYDQYNQKRREMIDALEEGEKAGTKRKRDDDELQAKIRAAEADMRRRKELLRNKRQMEAEAEAEAKAKAAAEAEGKEKSHGQANSSTSSQNTTEAASVQFRWSLKPAHSEIDTAELEAWFSRSGKVEALIIPKLKKRRKGKGIVCFADRIAAKKAVREAKGGVPNVVDSVSLLVDDDPQAPEMDKKSEAEVEAEMQARLTEWRRKKAEKAALAKAAVEEDEGKTRTEEAS